MEQVEGMLDRFVEMESEAEVSGSEGRADSGFTLVQLVPGQYRLRAERPGHLALEGALDLVEGEHRTVDEGVLEPGGLDESGRVDTEDLLEAARALSPGVGPIRFGQRR